MPTNVRRAAQGLSREGQRRNSLQEKLKAAANSDAVLAIAKEASFVILADDSKKAQSEFSDEELEAAAGGMKNYYSNSGCLLFSGL